MLSASAMTATVARMVHFIGWVHDVGAQHAAPLLHRVGVVLAIREWPQPSAVPAVRRASLSAAGNARRAPPERRAIRAASQTTAYSPNRTARRSSADRARRWSRATPALRARRRR